MARGFVTVHSAMAIINELPLVHSVTSNEQPGHEIRFAKPKLQAESCFPAAMQQMHGSGAKSNGIFVCM